MGNLKQSAVSGTNITSLTTTYTLDTYGRPTKAVDPNQNPITYSYNTYSAWSETTCSPPAGTQVYLTSITNARSQVTSFKYDSCTGALGSMTDPNGQTTFFQYDILGRVTKISYPDGGYKQNIYTDTAPNSIQTSQAQSSSSVLSSTVIFDGVSRPIESQVTDPAPYSTDFTDTAYDALGRVSSVSNPYRTGSANTASTNGTTYFYYDALGKKIIQTQPDGSKLQWCYLGLQDSQHPQSNCRNNQSSFSGSWIDSADEIGNVTQNVFDAGGRLRAVVEPYAYETDYDYDGFGNLLQVDQWGGVNGSTSDHQRKFVYDALSRLTSSDNPETGTITYNYSKSGSLCAGDISIICKKTDARGITTQYTYDNLNRLTAKTYSDGITLPVSLSYDSSTIAGATNTVGRLTSETVANGGTVVAQSQPYAYDAMGRLNQLLECAPGINCSSSPYHLAYAYDLAGHVIASTNGIPNTAFTGNPSNWESYFGSTTANFNLITVPSVLLTPSYDGAGRLNQLTSSWSDTTNHPGTLFLAASTANAPAYDAAGHLWGATIGKSTSTVTANLARTYDNRLRITSETDTGSATATIPATASTGTITIVGAEQQGTGAPTQSTATINITGSEGTHQVCISTGRPPVITCHTVADTGTIAVQVNTFTVSATYSGSSTDNTLCTALATALTGPGSPVTATCPSGGSIIDLTSIATGTAANYSLSVTNGADFKGTDSGTAMTGGANGSPIYDSGTITVSANSETIHVPWGLSDTPATIANNIATQLGGIPGGGFYVHATGSTVYMESTATGTGANWTISASGTYDSAQFSQASFVAAVNGMSGGTNSSTGPQPLYSYSIPSGGYLANGNLQDVADSIMGAWTYGYDSLSRLTQGYAKTGNYQNAKLTWSYDPFGNRTAQTSSTGSLPSLTQQFNATNNQMTGINNVGGSSTFVYDESGDVTYDSVNHYLYDAEGRICASSSGSGGYVQYIYDAEGARVAKGTVASLSCNLNSISATNSYVVGAGGQQITELALQSGQWTWKHSNIFNSGKLFATYNPTGSDTYFSFTDWLGTKRFEWTPDGQSGPCASLPFGDGLNCSGMSDATEEHFTGKKRDSESGLDYFGARYLSSSMGRFMSPDWSATPAAIPFADPADPQSLNQYSYVKNNPLNRTDPNGHNWFDVNGKWSWHEGDTWKDGKNTYTSKYTGLLVATQTGTDKKTGATTYSLTLYDQNKAVATGTGFSGGEGHAPVKDGNYIIHLDIRDPNGPNTITYSSGMANPPKYYGIQAIHDIDDSNGHWPVVGAYGPMRALLNPTGGAKDDGDYFHGQTNGHGWTHGCLCYGADTRFINYMWNNMPLVPMPVSIDTPVQKP